MELQGQQQPAEAPRDSDEGGHDTSSPGRRHRDLPPLRRYVLPIPIEDRDKYLESVRALLAEIRLGGTGKADALTHITALAQQVGKQKLPFVCQWIDSFLAESDGKLLVFGIHHEVLEYLHRKYKHNSVLIYGKRDHAKRLRDEDSFQKDSRVRLNFLNIHAGGVGLNLTAAHTAAVIEFPWRPMDLEQAISRGYARVGDIHGLDAYYLVGVGTIEEHIVRLLQKKQDISDQVIDGAAGISDFNISDQLYEMLRKGEV